jgi:hypothetical protein
MPRFVLLILSITVVCLLTLSVTASTGEQSESVSVPSLCALVQHPRKFTGKRVRVEANLESDGMHGSWLEDASCKARVVLTTSEQARENPDIKALEETIFHGMGRAGTVTKQIRAVFDGNFRWRAHGGPTYEFEMEAVKDVRVSQRAK